MYQNKQQQWNDAMSKYAWFRTGDKTTKEYVESKRPLANFKALPNNQVVSVLRNESDEWINMLSKEEKRAIKKHIYNSGDKKPDRLFERLNAMRRGDIKEDEILIKYSNTISGALKKNTLKHYVICYRKIE